MNEVKSYMERTKVISNADFSILIWQLEIGMAFFVENKLADFNLFAFWEVFLKVALHDSYHSSELIKT